MATKLTVTGMSCGGCEQNVVEALESVDGVESATADNETDTATAEGSASTDDLVRAVEEAGYSAST